MERREKVTFILDQMRLCLKNKDHIRAQIISKKVSIKYFEDEETHDLKLAFYQLMIELDKNEGSFLDICKHYHAIYETPRVKNNENDKRMALKCVVLYVCLAGYSNEQSDFMHRVSLDKELKDDALKSYAGLLTLFLTPEIINWAQLEQQYSSEFRSTGSEAPDVFRATEDGDSRWKSLRDRVVEHNIRIMTKYYTKVSLSRMSVLLDLPVEEVENCVSRLVFKKMIYARIDGLTNIVSFQQPRDASKVLDDWSVNINSLMLLLSHTSHLIDKEIMVQRANKPVA
jgi:26S proteasome regulatory subunit N5